MSQTRAIYVGTRERADRRKILHSQYTLTSHAEGTGFRTCEQEGLPAESKSDMRAAYEQQQQRAPVQRHYYSERKM
jgi:hypothetical protein